MSDRLDTVLEFISICIFEYLYVRKVYPLETFDTARALEIVVHVTRIEELADYVADTLKEIKPYLQHGKVHQLCVLLTGESGEVVEKLEFKLVGEGSLSDIVLSQSDARAALMRIVRLDAHQPPQVKEFTLVFEVDSGYHSSRGIQANTQEDYWLTRMADQVKLGESSTKPHILPISTFADETSSLRLCTNIYTAGRS